MRIEAVRALEILDSRGRPTVQAMLQFSGHAPVIASVPSGASTGSAEAIELRDGDQKRYGGLGCRRAVGNVNGEIATAVIGRDFSDQAALDRALIELDGTPDKSRLGANAILAVSIALARASAAARNVPLYQHFADMIGQPLRTLPRLTVNLFSGGKHAGGQVPIQDLLVVPATSKTIDEGLATVYAVYQAAAKLTNEKYGSRALKADEGGLAPPFRSIEEMFDVAIESIRAAGFSPGDEVALAVDVASTHFYDGDVYHLPDGTRNAAGMIETLKEWIARWPIVSVEDGLFENDWTHWPALNRAIGSEVLVLGDDFLCTNPARIRRAIETKAANALLLKVNQIGTLTEAA
ncbi:MAG: enolase, partial [Phycisphaerales bacterium]|nr:enolase [Phycisphaerales bacterium]